MGATQVAIRDASATVTLVGYCSRRMREPSSPAVETQGEPRSSTANVPAAERAISAWPRRGSRVWRYALLRRLLAVADVSAVLLASLSLLLAGAGQAGQFAWSLIVLPLWIVIAKLLGLYDRDEKALRHLTVDEAPHLVLWAVLGASTVSVVLELGSPGWPSASSALTLAVVAGVSAFVLRALMRLTWRTTTPPDRVAIIGAPAAARSIRRKLELFPDAHMTVVSEHEIERLDEIAADPGSFAGVDRLFVVPSSFEWQQLDTVLELARTIGVRLSVVPPNRAAFGASVQLNHLADLPVFDYRIDDLSRSTLLLKRALDVTVSAVALVVLSPVLLLAAAAIKLEDHGPVLFTQSRSGQHGRAFRMLKFRTMVVDAEALLTDLVPFDRLADPMFKLANDPRVTRVGRVLRRWSLDELPQLVNVLKGGMSLVGPRPEQVELVERYSDEQKRIRLALKPGMTGPMQVYGRGLCPSPSGWPSSVITWRTCRSAGISVFLR